MAQERAIPYSLEAEEAVIGSILVNAESINEVIDILTPKDFFTEDTASIYKVMVALKARDEEISEISVGMELQILNKPGLIAYLSHTISVVPSPLLIKSYADVVQRCSFYRQLLGTSGQIAIIAIEQNPDIKATLDRCESIIQELRERTTPESRRLILGKPRLIETNPPRYIWNVNGKDLRFSLPEITIWGKFKNRVISELNFVPIKPRDWDNTINTLITHSLAIEAPADASEEQQLKILILRWFERMREASIYSDLAVGRHHIKEVGGTTYYFFKSTPLLDYLKKEYKRGINSEDLWMSVHKWHGIKHKIRIKTPTGSMPTDLWGVPMAFAEEEKEEKAPSWF
ncbi:hypothetical protein KKF82_08045 [Patescibacteria group bacterium]|uniref:Putative helicase n=1 Tax=viral metagenome TaxID=1070528 RepID=A0A6M3MAL5_9ZZZZ|nr:hypothetical protein [Patescibacteria group bacterium]